MNWYMKLGSLTISPNWFNILPFFLGMGLLIHPSRNTELEKRFLKEGGFVSKRERRRACLP